MAKKNTKTMKNNNKNKKNRKTHGTTSLPTALRKELASSFGNKNHHEKDRSDGEGEQYLIGDEYEYEEGIPEEETKKNRRYDQVEKLEYELPLDFEDEEIEENAASGGEESDSEDGNEYTKADRQGRISSDSESDEEQSEMEVSDISEDEAEGEDAHERMIQDITGMSADALEDKPKKKKNFVVVEKCPESEYNLDHKVSGPDGTVTLQDLIDPLRDTSGFGLLRKKVQKLEKSSLTVPAPLPKFVNDKLERKAAYTNTKEEVTKWQPLVKKNRESLSITLDNKADFPKTSTGVLVSDFKPTTDLEKEIMSLLQDKGVVEAQKYDGAELLELNKVTVEEVKERQGRLAKMRSLMFKHELKAKHLKKIKSKTFHRLLKKERLKSGADNVPTDPEAAREYAMKQEFKRAEERMTLKHKNTSKWAKRALQRGLDKQDEGTRAAITEQLHLNNMLTRKINSMKEDSESAETSSEDDDEDNDYADNEDAKSLIIQKAKEETLRIIGNEDDNDEEELKSGILSLPFMKRGMEKRKKQTQQEAAAALQEFDDKLLEKEEGNIEGGSESQVTGRLAFGKMDTKVTEPKSHRETVADFDMRIDNGYESEDGNETGQHPLGKRVASDDCRRLDELDLDLSCLQEVQGDTLAQQEVKTAGPLSVKGLKKKKNRKVDSRKPNSSHASAKNLEAPELKKDTSSKKKDTSSKLPDSDQWLYGVNKDNSSYERDPKTGAKSRKQNKTDKKTDKNEILPSISEIDKVSDHKVSVAGVPKETSIFQSAIAVSDKKTSSVTRKNKEAAEMDYSESSEDEAEAPKRIDHSAIDSQASLIQQAFAGDDVEAEFQHTKSELVNEELPATEAVVSLPGWGQWTNVQQKVGMPSWILNKQEEDKKKREEALKKRKDAKLNFVVISEKKDKKAEKYNTLSLPFPYDSRETYERTLRMPLGPEFNTVHAHQNMIKPAVIKRAGVIIEPIKFEQKHLESNDKNESLSNGKRKRSGQKKRKSNANKAPRIGDNTSRHMNSRAKQTAT